MMDGFYLQDSRSYVGNDMLFWAKDGGYTTDVSKAQVYSHAEAQAKHNARESDIPWPKAYIDAHTRPAVDMQHVRRAKALAGSGIELHKPQRLKPETYRCHGCGRLMKIDDYYGGTCRNCGTDNRP
ncbi:hypothetical protein [Paludibacterium purpuratum]|uniref:Uncharacterized protein n=1 Tax=Paludibacterium purpuratum TaxID=1144873 RepID=A0A4V6PZB3_9NEIS|nr:hypothetical protein [Paludibacterium purpuratum]TDR82159.1 hypothetical protein DFP86_102273 [Paludibacterium purpuratum]